MEENDVSTPFSVETLLATSVYLRARDIESYVSAV
jgi:hypothetical protein